MTFTGKAASVGVPAMNEPVTTTSSTVAAPPDDWAVAGPAAANAIATANHDPPQRYLRFNIDFSSPRPPSRLPPERFLTREYNYHRPMGWFAPEHFFKTETL
jgi:hypothetical protein